MKIRESMALTFDDVLLVPRRSPVKSRSDVDTSTCLSRNIRLDIPIVSANMDTVTEGEMAVTMARAGGIGIIHRFMTVERQAEEVRRVKRAESHIVEAPYTVGPDATWQDVRKIMLEQGVGGLVVVDSDRRPLGILTHRDVKLQAGDHQPVTELMTPASRLVTAPAGTTMEEARRILAEHRIEKLPLLDADGRLAGLITAKDIMQLLAHPRATKDQKGRLRVGAAVGVRPGSLERAARLLEAGADVLVVDIAHGHSDNAVEMVKSLRREFPKVEIIAGNVATADGTRDLIEAGADAIKVGIGPGSICITRIVTGFGVPQLTAVAECVEVARPAGIPVIADGGIRTSGDVVKALAAGADSVMLGSLLAGTDESPGLVITRHGQRYKVSRGMASLGAALGRPDRQVEAGQDQDPATSRGVAEGVEAAVPYRGAVNDVLTQLVGGLRSGLSYGGAMTIPELQANAEFVLISQAGVRESGPHDVELI
ncbi:MAG TPA: IMP dehydrogenase [Anaerolineae bacterium]